MKTTKKLELGENQVSNSDYHADREYLSSSNLKLILKDAEQFYKERFLGQERIFKNQSVLDEGSLTHALLLEPENVDTEFAFYPGWTKRGNEFDQFKQAYRDKIIISAPQKHRCEKYVEAFKNRKEALDQLSGGRPELSICTEIEGIKLKMRADYINVEAGYIQDIKTTGQCSGLESFKITMDQFGYTLSAALYCMIAEQVYKKPFDFYFAVISKPEFQCDVYKLSKTTFLKGKQQVLEALKRYKTCMQTNKWVNYTQKIEINDEYEILEV